MTLDERIKTILTEKNLKQVDFAKALGVSPNYVNQLVNGRKKTISTALAKLIESLYGFSSQWIMTGEGEKLENPSLSVVKLEFIKKISKMSDDEVAALLAFANSLDSVRKILGASNH